MKEASDSGPMPPSAPSHASRAGSPYSLTAITSTITSVDLAGSPPARV